VAKSRTTLLGLKWVYSGSYDANYEELLADNNGNLRLERLEYTGGTAMDRAYGYDLANRVTSYTETGRSQSYAYDGFGNVWQTSAVGVPALAINDKAWYLPASGVVSNRLKDVEYDAAGNQLQLSLGAAGVKASYDAEGRMTEVKSGTTLLTSYEYDADGRRVKRIVGSGETAVATYYVYDADGQLMSEYGGSDGGSGSQYVVPDYLGSTRLLLDESGGVRGRIDYAPFGAQVLRAGQAGYASEAATGSPLFTGAEREKLSTSAEVWLDHLGMRYYASLLARFMSPDPENAGANAGLPGSWNGYVYALNNPLTFVDPTGLGPCPTRMVETEGGTARREEEPCVAELWYERWVQAARDTLREAAKAIVDGVQDFRRSSNCAASIIAASKAIGGTIVAGRSAQAGAMAGFAAGSPGGPVAAFAGGAAVGVAGGALGWQIGNMAGGAVGGAVSSIICNSGTGEGGGGSTGGTSGGSWNYGGHKSAQKWKNQMAKRGWTGQQINEAISSGKQVAAPNNVNPANGATRYIHPTTGRSVVVDNVTRQLLHVGGDGFRY
jgi:RHS repeat-associated protein